MIVEKHAHALLYLLILKSKIMKNLARARMPYNNNNIIMCSGDYIIVVVIFTHEKIKIFIRIMTKYYLNCN